MNIENKILKELLDGEFSDLRPRPKIKWGRWREYSYYTCDTNGDESYDGVHFGWVRHDINTGWHENIIYLNQGFKGMKKALREDVELLRNLLRHECLHLLTGLADDDQRFEKELKKRKIGLKRELTGVGR